MPGSPGRAPAPAPTSLPDRRVDAAFRLLVASEQARTLRRRVIRARLQAQLVRLDGERVREQTARRRAEV